MGGTSKCMECIKTWKCANVVARILKRLFTKSLPQYQTVSIHIGCLFVFHFRINDH